MLQIQRNNTLQLHYKYMLCIVPCTLYLRFLHIINTWNCGTAQLCDFPGFPVMYLVFKQGEFVSDWCAKRCRPPIQGALVETMGCSQPVLPSFPVRRDKGAKGRCRLISANLISAVCFLFYMGCTLIEITNKTGLNWVNYIAVWFFFLLPFAVIFPCLSRFFLETDAPLIGTTLRIFGGSAWWWLTYIFLSSLQQGLWSLSNIFNN